MSKPLLRGRRRAPLFLRLVTPLLYAPRITKLQPAPRSAFILSTGRTGTVYLAELLNQVEGVTSVHEPKPSRILNAWTTAALEGLVSTDYMAAALASKRRKLWRTISAQRLYVESNNFIAGFADALDQLIDNPTIIHIVRDPREFVTSLTNRGDNAGLRRFFNRYVPYWAYVPTGVHKRQLTPLTRAAYRWAAINDYLSEYGQRHPDKYHVFKFEDVFNKQDTTELKHLLEACGLTAEQVTGLDFEAQARHDQPRFSLLDRPKTSANQSKRAEMTHWPDWTDAEKQQLYAICGPLMLAYGYGSEKDWLAAVGA